MLGHTGTTRAQALPGFAEDPPVTGADLEAALSSDGEFEEVQPWGRVWAPSPEIVGEDFVPYLSNGRWIFGAYGWTFDSTYPWGWAAFHFGRWIHLADRGWVWTCAGGPGGGRAGGQGTQAAQTWGPAWVAWRSGNGFAGWAPLPPGGGRLDPHQYASLWSVVQVEDMTRRDLTRYLSSPDMVASATAAAPPGIGSPAAPLAGWRGYPHLQSALALASGAAFLTTVLGSASSATLWTGPGSSVHAPMEMGRAAGASPLWTGPGSSVFASPGFGSSTTAGQQASGRMVAPRPPHGDR
jgi:hypothetical protein